MHPITLLAFQDELEKLGFNVMESAAKEGIELAKKLKAKNLVPKAGNALKDYMGHMDLSAHPKFSAGVKATAQGGMKKVAITLVELPIAGGALGAVTGAAYGLARPGKDAQGKQKSRLKSAVRKGAIGAGIGAVGLPVGVIGGMAGAKALSKLGSSSSGKKKAASAAAELGGLGAGTTASFIAGKLGKKVRKEKTASALTDESFEKLARVKLSGVPKGLRAFANRLGEYSNLRLAAHRLGKKATRPKSSLILTGKEVEMGSKKMPSPLEMRGDIENGKKWRGMSKKELAKKQHASPSSIDQKINHKSKKASAFAHGAELAGLGLLAAPSVAHMRGKEWSEKNKARAEVAGLGVLAAPSALAVGKAGLAKLKGAISKMPKHAAYSIKEAVSAEWVAEKSRSGAYGRQMKKLQKKPGKSPTKTEPRRSISSHKHRPANIASSSIGRMEAIRDHFGLEHASNKARFNKEMKGIDRSFSKAKKVGLTATGLVAAGLAAYGGKKLYDHVKSKKKHASSVEKVYDHFKKKKEAAPSMSAMMNMHRLADAAKAAKSTVKPLAQAAIKLPNAAQQATRATQLAGHTAQGGHAWNAAAQAKRAIPL